MKTKFIIFNFLVSFFLSIDLRAQSNQTIIFSEVYDTTLFPQLKKHINSAHITFQVKTYREGKLIKTNVLSDTNNLAKFVERRYDTFHFALLMPGNNVSEADSYSVHGEISFLYNDGGGKRAMKLFSLNVDREIPSLKIIVNSIPKDLIVYYFKTPEWKEVHTSIFKAENKIELEKHRFGRGYTPTFMNVKEYTYIIAIVYNNKVFIRYSAPDYDNPICTLDIDPSKEKEIDLHGNK